MGIFTRLFTPGAMPSVQAEGENMTPQEPTDKEKKVPPPAPSGVRSSSSASTPAVRAPVGGPGEKSGLPLPKPPPPSVQSAQGKLAADERTENCAFAFEARQPNSIRKPKHRRRRPSSFRRPISATKFRGKRPAVKTSLVASSKPPKKSVRPSPPVVPTDSDTTPALTLLDDASSIAATFESLLGDLDEHFGNIVENEFQQSRPGTRSHRERSR